MTIVNCAQPGGAARSPTSPPIPSDHTPPAKAIRRSGGTSVKGSAWQSRNRLPLLPRNDLLPLPSRSLRDSGTPRANDRVDQTPPVAWPGWDRYHPRGPAHGPARPPYWVPFSATGTGSFALRWEAVAVEPRPVRITMLCLADLLAIAQAASRAEPVRSADSSGWVGQPRAPTDSGASN